MFEKDLMMPDAYAVMDEEEMTYVDGGVKAWWNSTWFVGGAIDVALYLVPVIAAANKATKAGKALKTALKAVGATKKKMISGGVKLLKKVGFRVSTGTMTHIVNCIWTMSQCSIGGLLALGMDIADGNRNGYCFG